MRHRTELSIGGFLCLVMLVVCPARAAETPMETGAKLQAMIDRAIAAKQPSLTIAPGTYRIAPPLHNSVHLTIRQASHLSIHAEGVTLVCARRTRALTLDDCQDVTLTGLTIDYDPLTFTQGTITAIAPDQGSIDIKIHKGYPREPYDRIDIVDPRTRFRKEGMPFLWGTKAAMISADTVRITLKDIGKACVVGDLASLSAGAGPGGIPHALTIDNGRGGITLKDVTIHCAPGMGIVEGGGAGGTHLDGVHIVPGPTPAGATEARLLTTSWDGILHSNVHQGPTVENCVIEQCGDDSWSVQTADYLVLKHQGTTVVIASLQYNMPLQAGDSLTTGLSAPKFKTLTLTPITEARAELSADVRAKLDAAPAYTRWKVNRTALALVTFDRDPGWPAGESLYSPDRQGNGFIFRHNRLHSSGRVLIKAGDGLVEDNELRSPHAIVVCLEAGSYGAAGLGNLIIRRNHIFRSGYFCPAPWSTQAGAISITADGGRPNLRPAGVFDHIIIDDNILEEINGVNIVVSSTNHLEIKGNQFIRTHLQHPTNTGEAFEIKQDVIIYIARSRDVTVAGNHLEGVGRYCTAPLAIGPDVDALHDRAAFALQ